MFEQLLKFYLGDKSKASLVCQQTLALSQVYKGLYDAWETYSQANINEGGPFKDASILTYIHFPVFEGKDFLTVFYHAYTHDGQHKDTIDHRLVYANDQFIDPWLMDLFGGLYFHHNDIKPSQFKKLFQNKIIERIG